LHNTQCLEQRESVIAPGGCREHIENLHIYISGAPAAERLLLNQRRIGDRHHQYLPIDDHNPDGTDGGGAIDDDDYSRWFLFDEVGFEEDEYAEDISIPLGGVGNPTSNSYRRAPRMLIEHVTDAAAANTDTIVCEEIVVVDPEIVVDDV
jgi:hypothetical protein